MLKGYLRSFRLSTVFPDDANLLARVLIRAVATGFVTFGGHTLMHLAQMATEVTLRALHATPCAINALRCNLVGMVQFAPFLRDFYAYLVVVLYCAMRASQVSQLMPQ